MKRYFIKSPSDSSSQAPKRPSDQAPASPDPTSQLSVLFGLTAEGPLLLPVPSSGYLTSVPTRVPARDSLPAPRNSNGSPSMHTASQTKNLDKQPTPEKYAMPAYHGNKLCGKSREIVSRVLTFNAALCSQMDGPAFADPYVLTSQMVGISVKTLKRLPPLSIPALASHDYTLGAPVNPVLPPCSTAPLIRHTEKNTGDKLASKLAMTNPMLLEVIRNHIHKCYVRQERIVMAELNETLTRELVELDFRMSNRSLCRLLKAIGFRYQKVRDRCILFERADLVDWRFSYLKRIKEYRKQGAYLVFSDESWVFEGVRYAFDWVDQDVIENPMKYHREFLTINPAPSASRGKRAIIVGAISEDGILEGTFKVWGDKGMSDDGDYHRTMNAAVYESWLLKVLPIIQKAAGKRQPVLIIDNARYHSEVAEKIPTTASKKADIVEYLKKNGKSCDMSLKKPDLLKLLDAFLKANGGRTRIRRYKVDDLARAYGVDVLRLPAYHCTLNPIEYFWGWLKTKLAKNAKSADRLDDFKKNAMKYIAEMPDEMKANFFAKAEKNEDDFVKKEGLVFLDIQDKMVIPVRMDSDDSMLGSDEESDGEYEWEEDSEEERMVQELRSGRCRA